MLFFICKEFTACDSRTAETLIKGVMGMDKVKYLPIINRSDSCKLKVNDICFVTRDNKKLVFGTEDGVKRTYGKMDQLEEYLEGDFVRCMSGCIINLAKVREVKDGTIRFDNGDTLKLGREGYVRVKQKFNAYLMGLLPSDDDEGDESGEKH